MSALHTGQARGPAPTDLHRKRVFYFLGNPLQRELVSRLTILLLDKKEQHNYPMISYTGGLFYNQQQALNLFADFVESPYPVL